MQSLKNFFNRITQCAIDPASYRTLRAQGLGSAYWYLYRLLFLTSLVVTLWIAAGFVHAVPHMRNVANEIQTTLPTLYPKQLVVKVQSGALTTNMKEPVVIALPAKWAAFFAQKDEPDDEPSEKPTLPPALVIIDTKAKVEDYDQKKSLVLLTKNYAVAGKENGEVRMMPYDKLEKPLDVNYNDYQDGLKKMFAGAKGFLPVAKAIVVVSFIIAPFLFAGLGLLWWMFILLISSLLLAFISGLSKWHYTYGEIYRLSVFGATPVVILGMLFWLLGLSIPWVLQIYFFVWMWMILKKLN